MEDKQRKDFTESALHLHSSQETLKVMKCRGPKDSRSSKVLVLHVANHS